MERFREKNWYLHKLFTDLEKIYDRVLREIMWWTLKKKQAPGSYIDTIKDMMINDDCAQC